MTIYNISIPTVLSRAASLGFSEQGVFIRSMRRARFASTATNRTPEEKFVAVISQLEQAQRRIEMSSAYQAGLEGKEHARIATANSLHVDVTVLINEIVAKHPNYAK